MRSEHATDTRPANDAQLIEAVRTALGRDERFRGGLRINVSSCSFVVSLHGSVANEELKTALDDAVREIPGVEDVKNELRSC